MWCEACHTYEWVSHVTHKTVTCYPHVIRDMPHVWMSHVTRMNESCHTYEWVMSHNRTSHDTHVNESCQTYEWVMSHTCVCVCDMTRVMRHMRTASSHNKDVHMCEMPPVYVWHNSSITSIHTCDTGLYYEPQVVAACCTHINVWDMYTCAMTHSYMWHRSVLWLQRAASILRHIQQGHINESCHTYTCLTHDIHVTHMNTYATRCNDVRLIIQTCVTQMNESYHTFTCHTHGYRSVLWAARNCSVLHTYSHIHIFICVKCLLTHCPIRTPIHATTLTCTIFYVLSAQFFSACRDMTHSFVWHRSVLCAARDCSVLHTSSCVWCVYVWYDSFMCIICINVTWLIHICDTGLHYEPHVIAACCIHIHVYVYVWHDSFIFVIQVYIISRTWLQRAAYIFMCMICIRVTWLIHICDTGLHYEPHVIAVCCIHLAAALLNMPLPCGQVWNVVCIVCVCVVCVCVFEYASTLWSGVKWCVCCMCVCGWACACACGCACDPVIRCDMFCVLCAFVGVGVDVRVRVYVCVPVPVPVPVCVV